MSRNQNSYRVKNNNNWLDRTILIQSKCGDIRWLVIFIHPLTHRVKLWNCYVVLLKRCPCHINPTTNCSMLLAVLQQHQQSTILIISMTREHNNSTVYIGQLFWADRRRSYQCTIIAIHWHWSVFWNLDFHVIVQWTYITDMIHMIDYWIW